MGPEAPIPPAKLSARARQDPAAWREREGMLPWRTIRRLSIASLIGQLAWVAIVVAAGLAEPGYSEIRDAVSELGAGTAAHPWTFNTGVAIWGLSFIAAAVALLGDDAPRGVRGWLGPALIAFTGVSQILAGFPFPADCRTTIDAGCEAREMAGEVSWQHVAHGWAYFLGSIAILLSVFAMAWRFHGDRRWGRADLLSAWAGVLGIVIFGGLFFLTDDKMGGHYGLVQRLSLAAGGIWVAALAIGLLAIHGRDRDLAVRFVRWIRSLPGGRMVVVPRSGRPGRGA
jgi:hypothetical protein